MTNKERNLAQQLQNISRDYVTAKILTDKIKASEETTGGLINSQCGNLDTRIDNVIKEHLSVNDLIGGGCQFNTMSDWAKNMTSSTSFNFDEIRSSMSQSTEDSQATLIQSEIKIITAMEETKQFLLDHTETTMTDLENTKLTDIRDTLSA